MKKIFFVLASMLLLLAACTDGEVSPTAPFIGGTQGLKIEYLPSFPPDRVSDGNTDPFDVIVKITNRGESEVAASDVRVTLSGFPASQFGTSVTELSKNAPELIERNEKNPDGSIVASVPVEVEFLELAYQNVVQGSQPFPFRADICYKYTTQVSSTICVKDDFRRDAEGDVCQVASTRQAFNSGAPIQVTRLTQTAAGSDRTRISFTIENRDTGRVFEQGHSCSTDARREDRVFLSISGFEGSGESVECRGLRDGTATSGVVYLDEATGSVDVTCDISISERSPRIQPFSLEITYDYNENIQSSVVVERN